MIKREAVMKMPISDKDPETKKRISEILKRVDMFVKEGKLKEAADEVARGRDIDARNMYVHAYQERLQMLKEQERRNREASEGKQISEEAGRRRQEAIARKEWEEGVKKLHKQKVAPRRGSEKPAPVPQTVEGHSKALEAYNRALFEVWVDGAATTEEEKRLNALRSSQQITVEEHLVLEASVKRECYVAAFRNMWSSGSLTPEGSSTLTALRKKFDISSNEFEAIELELLHELRPGRREGTVLLIDDDPGVLRIVEGFLIDYGFGVRAYTTSDDAYKYLKSNTPDLIISDVNLETSTMGGIAFLEKVRDMDHLLDVPFIFLSGLTDEVVIRAGKALGAEDYITKPFDPETMIAVIRGKLKRFRQLRTVSINEPSATFIPSDLF